MLDRRNPQGCSLTYALTAYDAHIQSGRALHTDITAFLLARGANPLRQHNGVPTVAETETRGHWPAAEIMRAWIDRGQTKASNMTVCSLRRDTTADEGKV